MWICPKGGVGYTTVMFRGGSDMDGGIVHIRVRIETMRVSEAPHGELRESCQKRSEAKMEPCRSQISGNRLKKKCPKRRLGKKY